MKIGLYLHLEGWVTNENGSKGWSGDYHSLKEEGDERRGDTDVKTIENETEVEEEEL